MGNETISAIDLFCGAGGFTKGLELAEIDVIAGFDFDARHKETYENNNKSKFINHDVSKAYDLENKIDLIVASPPCQGYSDARGNREPNNTIELRRNNLYQAFVWWVKKYQPKVSLFENVSGFKTHSNNGFLHMENKLKELGYHVENKLLMSRDFGIPQNRRRFFSIAYLKDFFEHVDFFQKLIKNISSIEISTVQEGIEGIPKKVMNNSENGNFIYEYSNQINNYIQQINIKDVIEGHNHIAKIPNVDDLKIIKLIPAGKSFRTDRFGKKSVPIWDLAEKYETKYKIKLLSKNETKVLREISQKRLIADIKTRKENYQEGYVPLSLISNINTVKRLINKNYLKYNETNTAVDITSKAGHRGRFRRLELESQSPTILTQSFSPRELVHPVADRGLSLREGARIQSFPDDYIFSGSTSHIGKQIGNAVPPYQIKQIASLMGKLFFS